MNVAFILRTDGRREYIEQTIASVEKHVRAPYFSHGIIIDDSADSDYAAWLEATFPNFDCVHHPERLGLGGCYKSSLDMFLYTSDEWLFQIEDDTPVIGDVILTPLADVLNANESLSQLMFARPPFNQAEINAGGVFQQNPHAFTERTNGTDKWIEHSLHFGFQPALIPRRVVEYVVQHADNFLELGVTDPLKAAGYNFGYWGGLTDPPLCDHVGRVRTQNYRW